MVQGVRVYDARQDSTYPGGNGPCRLGIESTYVYSLNPAMHALTYAFGRYQVGIRIFGVGKTREGLDIPAFVEWANVCDANGWQVNGEILEPGDKWNNLKNIMQAGSARPTHKSGILSVTYDAPRVSVATFTEDDLGEGDAEIVGGTSFRDRLNSIVPRVRSPQHNFEFVPGSPFTVNQYVSEDGELKRREVQFSLCQSFTQGAQLAGYVLVNTRELDEISLPMKIGVIPFGPGEAVDLDMPNYGLSGQFIITSRRFDPLSSTFEMTFKSETPEKHAFALGATSTPPQLPRLVFGEEIDAARSAAGGLDDTIENLILSSWVSSLDLLAQVGTELDSSSISITDHQRIYSDEIIDVTGGAITGLENGVLYAIYYDDALRAGGTVNYVATKVVDEAQNGGEFEGRHFVGYVTTPAIGEGETTGIVATPPSLVPLFVPSAESLGGLSRSDVEAQIETVSDAASEARDDASEARDIAESAQSAAADALEISQDVQLDIDGVATDAQNAVDQARDDLTADINEVDSRVDDIVGDIGDVQSDITNLENTKADGAALTAEAERITALRASAASVSTPTDAMSSPDLYYSHTPGGAPGAIEGALSGDNWEAFTDSDFGDGIRNIDAAEGDWLVAKAILPFVVGKTYRARVTGRRLAAPVNDICALRIVRLNSQFERIGTININNPFSGSSTPEEVFNEYIATQNHYDDGTRYLRGAVSVRLKSGGSNDGLWEFYALDLIDASNDVRLDNVQANVTSLESTKADGVDLTAEAQRITALTSRVDDAEGDIGDVQSDITNLENTKADGAALTAEAERITALTSRVDDAEGDIGDVQSDICLLYTSDAADE